MKIRSMITTLLVSVLSFAVLCSPPSGRSAAAEDFKIRMTTGLNATSHSVAWIGTQAGIFKKYGLDVSFPKLAVGGPETAAGLMRGDWHFVQTGVIPIAENVLNGGDAVILLRNTVPNQVGVFLVARSEFKSLQQLAGKRVGVPADVHSGQTSILGRLTLEKAGVTAEYVVLGSYQRIFDALAAGEIDAGTLPIDFRFLGDSRHGWNSFETRAFGAPSIFGTTRRMIAENRPVVNRVVQAMVESIQLFKTRSDVVVPILEQYLNFTDRAAVERLRAFYAPLLPENPRPALGDMTDVRRAMIAKYPAARSLLETDIADTSIIDGLEKEGIIKKLVLNSRLN